MLAAGWRDGLPRRARRQADRTARRRYAAARSPRNHRWWLPARPCGLSRRSLRGALSTAAELIARL